MSPSSRSPVSPSTATSSRAARIFARLTLASSLLACSGYAIIACGDNALPATPTPDAASTSEASSDAGSSPDAPADTGQPDVVPSPSGSRPTSVACGSETRPAGGGVDAAAGGECTADDDCDAGTQGRCRLRRNASSTPHEASTCTYHACSSDQDCPGASSVCGCGVGWAGQNLCLTNSNCRTDGDCASGQRCVYSNPPILRFDDGVHQGNEVAGPNYSGDAIGYFCTTPNDDCDCPKQSSTATCIYNVYSKHWQCGYQP